MAPIGDGELANERLVEMGGAFTLSIYDSDMPTGSFARAAASQCLVAGLSIKQYPALFAGLDAPAGHHERATLKRDRRITRAAGELPKFNHRVAPAPEGNPLVLAEQFGGHRRRRELPVHARRRQLRINRRSLTLQFAAGVALIETHLRQYLSMG